MLLTVNAQSLEGRQGLAAAADLDIGSGISACPIGKTRKGCLH